MFKNVLTTALIALAALSAGCWHNNRCCAPVRQSAPCCPPGGAAVIPGPPPSGFMSPPGSIPAFYRR